MRNKEVFDALETHFISIFGEKDMQTQYEYIMDDETDKTKYLLEMLIKSHADQRKTVTDFFENRRKIHSNFILRNLCNLFKVDY